MASHAAPLDRIGLGAREFNIGRLLLTAVAVVLMSVGWCARKTVATLRLLIFALSYTVGWVCVAIREGWREASGPVTR